MPQDHDNTDSHARSTPWRVSAYLLAGGGFVAMAVALTYGFTVGNFFEEGGRLLRMPWGVVSLVDVYVGFALFCGWVAFRERCWWRAALWTVFVMTGGNLVACGYVLLTLLRTRGDWRRFWMGR